MHAEAGGNGDLPEDAAGDRTGDGSIDDGESASGIHLAGMDEHGQRRGKTARHIAAGASVGQNSGSPVGRNARSPTVRGGIAQAIDTDKARPGEQHIAPD